MLASHRVFTLTKIKFHLAELITSCLPPSRLLLLPKNEAVLCTCAPKSPCLVSQKAHPICYLGKDKTLEGTASTRALFFGRASSMSVFYIHPRTQDHKNKSGCCFPEKRFSWQKSVVDKIELATQSGPYPFISLDTFKTKMCFDTCRMSKMGLRRKAAITLCWCSSEGEAERITNELVSRRLETF